MTKPYYGSHPGYDAPGDAPIAWAIRGTAERLAREASAGHRLHLVQPVAGSDQLQCVDCKAVFDRWPDDSLVCPGGVL